MLHIEINGTVITPSVATTTPITVPNGTVSVSATGVITFTPSTGFVGSSTFPYKISDGYGGTATANEIINILPSAIDDNYTVTGTTPVTLLPFTLDTPNTTIKSINGIDLTPGVAQTITTPNSTVSIDAAGEIKFTANAGFTGVESFPYVIVDTFGQIATASEIITVNPSPLPPSAIDDNYTVTGTTPVTLLPLALDTPNTTIKSINGTDLTLGVAQTIATPNGTVNIDAAGEIKFTANTGFTGLESFPYVIVDTNGLTATANEKITVQSSNPPVANHDDYTTPVDTQVQLYPTDNDSHPNGVYFVVDSVNGQPLNVDTCYIVPHGQLCTGFNGELYFNPETGFIGFVTIPYTIYASNETNAASDITIKIGDPVIITAVDDNYTTTPTTPVTLNPLGSDTTGTTIKSINGVDLTPGTTQTITTSNGTVDIDSAGIIKFTPSAGFSGLESFPYVIQDGAGQFANAVEKITVSAPIVSSSSSSPTSSSSSSLVSTSSSLSSSSMSSSSSSSSSSEITVVTATSSVSSSSSSTSSSSSSITVAQGTTITIKTTPTILPTADLSITKIGDKVKTALGETLTYTITTTNNGPTSVSGAIILDILPSGYDVNSITCTTTGGSICPAGITAAQLNAGAAIPTLTSGSSVKIVIVGTVTTANQLFNKAEIKAPAGIADPNLQNNISEFPTIIDPPSGKKIGTFKGQNIVEWKQVWINERSNIAQKATISDDIPAGTTYVAGSLKCESRGISTTSSCTFDSSRNSTTWVGQIGRDLGNTTEDTAGNEVVVTFQILIPVDMNEIENQANITTETGGTNKSDNPVTAQNGDITKVIRPLEVVKQSDMEIAKIESINTIRTGGSAYFWIVIFFVLSAVLNLFVSLKGENE
jgi:large repetitive protein